MSEHPLVSVVIPAYKAERWVGETIRSVQAQTYPNLEIIVVDDGSPDDTAVLVEELAIEDKRIQLLRKENGGVGSARNAGIRIAHGEYIAPLDADDLWHPRKITKQVECFLGRKALGHPVGMVYCWSQSIDDRSRVIRAAVPRKPIEGDVFKRLLVENFLGNGSTPLIAKSALDQVGGYLEIKDKSGCEDWALYLRIAHDFEVYGVGELLVGYRRFDNSMSTDYHKMLLAHDLMLEDVKSYAVNSGTRLFINSRTAILLWMLAGERLGSEEFRDLFRKLWINDPLYLIRCVTTHLVYLMLKTRILRLLGVVVGASPATLFLRGADE